MLPDLAAVLPISDRDAVRRNLDRADMLLESISFFWRGSPLPIFVVCPDDEFAAIDTHLTKWRGVQGLNLIILSESQIHRSIGATPSRYGIAKHMLVKLAAPSFVGASHYLILDTDLVVCRPISIDNLVYNGRAATEYWAASTPAWWHASARILSLPEGQIDLSRPRMFVTPQVLSCDVVSSLHFRIESLHRQEWVEALLANFPLDSNDIWTEYTLYDLWANSQGTFEVHHLSAEESRGPRRLHCMEQSIWMPDQFASWDPGKALRGECEGNILVLQSITATSINFDDIRRRWYDARRRGIF